MCGIAGYIDLNHGIDRALLERMSLSLAKRGPDDLGLAVENGCGLVHRRLAIIDLAGGHQPIFNEDRSLAIICNGEIYDYQVLREQLQAGGHRFATHSDTEVVLHLYEERGAACLEELNGMFAVAIWHVHERRLFLARDRFGQKPLFYAQSGGRLAFASGPAALTQLPWVDATLDLSAVHDYLEYQYIPEPRSIYCGVRKFPPHTYGYWRDEGGLELSSYWSPSISADYAGTYGEACGELSERLRAAVRRRLVADVPVGLFLSGGLDSGLISALARREAMGPLHTFSIGFPERKYDERHFAETVARHLGTEHHFHEVCPDDFRHLERVVADFEEPFGDSSMLPTSLLSEFTRQHVKTVLSGDGADELFGGYYRYRVMHLMQLYAVCPAGLRRGLRQMLLALLPSQTEERTVTGRLRRLIEVSDVEGVRQYRALISSGATVSRQRIYGVKMQALVDGGEGPGALAERYREHAGGLAEAIMQLDISTYLNNDILVKVDRASMAYGLEVRSPFLDRDVAELALRLPYRWKQSGRRRKKILVDSLGHLLPPQITRRSKMGFGVPVARWFREQWRQPTAELLLGGAGVESEMFLNSGIEALLREHNENRVDHGALLFNLLVLEIWLRGRGNRC